MPQDKLSRWECRMAAFSLPEWEHLPELELYMDQVVLLIGRYLRIPGAQEEEKLITASIVNNYVRMKVMPPPVKKRYNRVHLAYLLMICTLKQSLNLSFIQKLLPNGIPEAEVAAIYDRFVRQYRTAVELFSHYTRMVLAGGAEDPAADAVQGDGLPGIAVQAAVVTNLSKALAEYLLSPEKGEEEPEPS